MPSNAKSNKKRINACEDNKFETKKATITKQKTEKGNLKKIKRKPQKNYNIRK
jgi:hypothetical protein